MNRRALILILILQLVLVGQVFTREIPTWDVIPADYQNSANMTAILHIDHVPTTDPNDILGAFVGEECRGVVSPVTMGEQQLFFLTMYSNQNTEVLTLKTYIAVLDTVITVNESIDFIPGAEYGTPTEPYGLNAIVFFDHAPIVTGISDQVIEIGGLFTSFDLDNHLTELDDDMVTWSSTNSPNLSVSLDIDNVVTIAAIDNEWIGTDSLFFTATDQTDSAYAGQDTALFTILPMDHPPEISAIPAQTIGNGGSFATIDLADYLIEQDGDSIGWSLAFLASGATDPVPVWSLEPADYNRTMSLTAMVSSRGAEVLTEHYQLAAFVDDECRGVVNPVLALGELTFFLTIYANSDGETLDLRLYDASSQLDLPILEQIQFQTGTAIGSPEVPVELQAGYIISHINSNNQASLTVVDPTWTGTETIQFFAQDIGTLNSYSDSASTSFTILPDHTPLVSGISDQTVELGQSFTIFDLDHFLLELDGDEVIWSISGDENLFVDFDFQFLVSVTPLDEEWTGSETVIFTVTDDNDNQFSSSDTVVFTILPIDHAPVVSDIPNQLIGNGGDFSDIILNDYLTEVDGHSIQWSYGFDTPLETDPIPSWYVNAADYESDMTLTASVSSRGLDLVHNNYSLAAFVGEECRGFVTPVAFGEEWLFFLTIYANGSGEGLNFRLYDGAIALDMPILETIFFEPATSVGAPETPYSMTAGFIQLNINASDEVEISALDPIWSGTENVWFTARDMGTENQFADSTLVSFTILEDHTPLVSSIPDQLIELGSSFASFDLNDHLTELDGDDLVWSIEGETNLSALINPDLTVTVSVVDDQWVGNETLTFIVTDVTANELFSSDSAIFTVIPVDHAPEISMIPNDTIGIGGEFLSLDLSQFLLEQDGDQIAWSYSYATALEPIGSPDWVVNPADFEHNMSLTAMLTLRSVPSVSSQNILAVFSGDDCHGLAEPVVVGENSLYFLTIYGNTNDEELELRIYDADRQDTLIIHENYTFMSNAVIGSPDDPELLTAQNLNLEFLTESILLPSHAYPEWTGTEVIKIFARDVNTPNEYLDSTQVYFTVLPQTSPSFLTISDQEIDEGGNFTIISLDDYLQFPEPEEVNWYVSSDESLQPTINEAHQLSVLIPDENWFGSETLNLEVQRIDNSALNAFQNIQFSVLPVNDAPQALTQTLSLDEDSSLEITFSGFDIELDELTFTLTQAPENGTFIDLLYQPILNFNGLDSLKYVAFDGELYSDTATVHLQIMPLNDLPEFVSTPELTVLEDATYQYQISATDVEGDSLVFEAVDLPEWLSFDGLNQLSGTPANDHVGLHQVRITLADTTEIDSLIWQEFSIDVLNTNDRPNFTSLNLDTAIQDIPFIFELTASDVDANDSLSYQVAELPDWLSFDSIHTLSGTPLNENVGEYHIVAIVSDLGLARDTLELDLIVENVNDLPVFTSTPQLTVQQDVLYQYHMTALDIDGDSVLFNTTILPDWLSFDGLDLLFGTPGDSDVGHHQVQTTVADPLSLNSPVVQDFSIAVGDVNDAPHFTSPALATAHQDLLFEYIVTAVDLDGDSLTYVVGELPDWLSLGSTNMLSGTPENAHVGEYSIPLFVFDPESASDTLNLQVTVQNVNDAPVFTSSAQDTAQQGVLFTYDLMAIDIDGDSLSYFVNDNPNWLTLSSSMAILSGTPENADVGELSIQLIVSDIHQAADTLDLGLVIQNVNDAPIALAGDDLEYLSGSTINIDGGGSYDIDGDSLSYEWLVPQELIFQQSTTAIATILLPQVTLATDYLISLRVFDGELFSEWDTLSVRVNVIAEVVSTDFGNTPQSVGESIALEITFPEYYIPVSAMLFYQSGGSSQMDSVPMHNITRSQVWAAEIPAVSVAETGLSYHAEAVDIQGNSVIIDTRSIPVKFDAGSLSMTTTTSPAYPQGILPGKWRLVSIPSRQDETDLVQVLEEPLGESHGEQSWRLYDWDGEHWQTPDTIELGQGYWFQHRLTDPVDLVLGSGSSIDLTGVELEMEPGWNLFSSPYNFPITCNIDSNRFSGPYAYGNHDGEGWLVQSDTLKPWAAYALFNWADTVEFLHLNPHRDQENLPKSNGPPDSWRLHISATNGVLSDLDNLIGQSLGASAQRDKYDQVEPPVWDDYLRVSILNNKIHSNLNHFAADIRPASETIEQWSMQLAVGQDLRDVKIDLILDGQLPTGHVIVGLDTRQRKWFEINSDLDLEPVHVSANYPIIYELLSGPSDQVFEQIEKLLSFIPERNDLAANYPNPFNGTTQIGFSLREPARVMLDIYDIRGRLVHSLIDETRDMGTYTATWSGLNDQGKSLSSGIYFYRIMLDPVGNGQRFQATRKLVLVR
ncbi:MAG: tandem-95 repeat protein [Candidatus Marinimicrobia bacterium]|nr:tandem-95 repeat protein [Candidatus Neomarinimicrobiota bacterium]